MAERVGFEPTLPFRVNTLSKRAPSATRPSLRRANVASGRCGKRCESHTDDAKKTLPVDSMVPPEEPQPYELQGGGLRAAGYEGFSDDVGTEGIEPTPAAAPLALPLTGSADDSAFFSPSTTR